MAYVPKGSNIAANRRGGLLRAAVTDMRALGRKGGRPKREEAAKRAWDGYHGRLRKTTATKGGTAG